MKLTYNPDMEAEVLAWINKRFELGKPREGTHLSSLIGCLTKNFFDQYQAIPLTKRESLLFSLGYGLQDIIAPTDDTENVHEYEGITFRPDFEMPMLQGETNILGEIKTTRKKVTSIEIAEDLPVSWLQYMKGVCKAKGKNTYELCILHIVEPDLMPWKVEFTDTEIEENWQFILERKALWDEAIERREVPTPYEYVESWECRGCRYGLLCEGITYTRQLEEQDESV